MATTVTNKKRANRRSAYPVFLLAGFVAVAATSAGAADLEPQVTIGITHTDNVFLAPEGLEESEKIYRIEPSFAFIHEASRVTINAEYLLQAFRYQDLSETEIFHQYDASIRAALIPEHFFFEVGGSRNQFIVDPEQSIPLNNLSISGNRQDRDEYYAAPSVRYAFSRAVVAEGEYRHTWLEYGESDLDSNEQGEANFSIDNYRQGQGITWALRYNWQRLEYERELPWEFQQATAELGFWVGDSTRLFAAGGKESAWDQPLDSGLEDGFWEAGIAQRIGERLSAEFAVGERTFGSSWRGNLAFEFRRGSTTLSYTESPTTAGRIRLRRGPIPGADLGLGDEPDEPVEAPIEMPEIPDGFLSRPGDTERFIAKRLEWTLSLEFRRSGLALALFDADRTERTEADGTLLPDESHRGGSLTAFYRLGPRTDFELGGSWIEREFQDGDTSELIRASLLANYRLGSRTTLSLGYEYAEEDGESLLAIRDYVANTVSLLLTRTW